MEKQPRKKRRMKKRVWRHLPRSVLVKVLSYLPLESLVGLRFLCREWRELAGTRLFEELWKGADARRGQSCLIVKYRYTNRKTARVYSTGLNSWLRVPNACFMPAQAFLLKDAHRGLTAARMTDLIAVGNPVTGKWSEFKPPSGCNNWATATWTLLVSPGQESFKLMLDAHVYDSKTSRWQQVTLPGDTAYGPILRGEGGERYYYLCVDQRQVKLIRGSAEQPGRTEVMGLWRDESLYPARHTLFNYRGDQVGMIRDTPQTAGSLTAYVFDEVREEWIEKSQMPREVWMRVVKERKEQKKANKEADLHRSRFREAWQMVSCGRYVGLLACGCSGLLLFDCVEHCWRWVEDPVQVQPFLRQTPLFGFELRL